MKFFSFLRRFACGESVTGSAHIAKSLPNQDSFLCVKKRKYLLLVVSDGMGSKPFADVGSQKACEAVKRQIGCFVRNKKEPLSAEKLLANIVGDWKALVAPHEPKDCSATCLFLFATKRKILAARLGDGMICLLGKNAKRSVLISDKKDGDFSNATCSLSDSAAAQEFSCSVHDRANFKGVVLSTDGISADLENGNELLFADGLFEEVRKLPFWRRRTFLRNMMEHWTVPHHTDDKTLIVAGF